MPVDPSLLKILTLKLNKLLHEEANLVPHGAKLMLETAPSTVRVDKHDPEVMSHVLMVVSSEALTTILGLSGLKATQFT